MIESLETRRLFAALVVNGTAFNDVITVSDIFGPATVVNVNGFVSLHADAAFTSLDIRAFGGNDSVTVQPNVFKPALIRGGTGSDILRGGSGHDRILGEDGHDYLFGNRGNDAMSGGRGFDRMFGNDGHDKMFGDADADYLYGGNGDDYLSGGTGNDVLLGEAGCDKLFGNDGDDYLNAGAGRDFSRGDAGKDTYAGLVDGALDTVHRNPFADVVIGGADVFDVFAVVFP